MTSRTVVCCVAVTILSVAGCTDTADTPEASTTEAALSADSFSIVVLPDTQYYSYAHPDPANSNYSWPFNDQASWIVAHHDDTDKKIQLVIGLGDITDDGGPRPTGEHVCREAVEGNWATQWIRADNAIKLLDGANIPYTMVIGNHDYDCQLEHKSGPQSRSTSNFDKWFGPSRYAGKSWFHGGRMNPTSNANFYNIVELGGKNYLVLALEFYPRDSVLAWANRILDDNPDLPVIVAMHAYLFPDKGAAGSALRAKHGDPDSAESYHLDPSCAEICTGDHACPHAVTASCDNGNNGDDMWTKFVSLHKNIVLVVNGHFQEPFPTTLDNNGVGYRTEIAPTGQRIDQIVSDFQGQGATGPFGNGYLRMYTISPSAGTLKTFTYSPPAAAHPSRFASGHAPPVTKTDAHNAFTIPFESSTSAVASVTVHEPAQGASVASPVAVEASYSGAIGLGHFEAWLDGTKLGNVFPANGVTTMSASYPMSTGAHKLTVLAVDADSNVIKSAPVSLTAN